MHMATLSSTCIILLMLYSKFNIAAKQNHRQKCFIQMQFLGIYRPCRNIISLKILLKSTTCRHKTHILCEMNMQYLSRHKLSTWCPKMGSFMKAHYKKYFKIIAFVWLESCQMKSVSITFTLENNSKFYTH